MCATETPLRATISSSTRSWQSSAGLPEDAGKDRGTGVGEMQDGHADSGTLGKPLLRYAATNLLFWRPEVRW